MGKGGGLGLGTLVPDDSDHGGATPCAVRPHGCSMVTWGVQVGSHGHKSSGASDHKA
jgi:hypothetical protein